MRRPVLLLLASAALVAAPSATAAPALPPPPPPGAGVAVATLASDGRGDPLLEATAEERGVDLTWRACDPECGAPIGRGTRLTPGPTAAGTVFEVRATVGGAERSARSPAWRGHLAVATPPTLDGEVRIGRPVAARPGTFSGGWGDDVQILGVRACRTPTAGDCRDLTPGGSGSAVVDPSVAGWWVGPYAAPWTGSRGGIPLGPTPYGVAPQDPAPDPTTGLVAVGALVGPVPPERPGVPPRIVGRPGAGRTVGVAPGSWPDAPDDARRATGLRLCPTAADTAACRLLAPITDADLAAGRQARLRIPESRSGWFVGAVERRTRAGQVLGTWPPTDAVPTPGPSAALGPLVPVVLAFEPGLALRRAVRVDRGRLVLGRVRCVGRCVVRLTVRGGGRTVRRRLVASGRTVLRVRRSALPRTLRRVRTTVRVDDAAATVTRTAVVRGA